MYNHSLVNSREDDEAISATTLGVLAGASGLAIIAAAYALFIWWREKNEPIKPIYMEPSAPPRPIPPRLQRNMPPR